MSEPLGDPPSVVLPMRGWLLASHLTVLLLPILGLVFSGALGQDLINQTRSDLEHQAALLTMMAETEVIRARSLRPDVGLECCSGTMSVFLRRVKRQTLAGIEVTDRDGRVVASSGATLGNDLSDRRHVQSALNGRPTTPAQAASPAVASPVAERSEPPGSGARLRGASGVRGG